MKILELTNFSAGVCGVWTRAKQESELLAKKGHIVKIFSSNLVKGTNETAPAKENLGKIEIIRFPAKKLGGESFMKWDFYSEAIRFHPDVIIAHSYRHPHTDLALKIKKKIHCKVFLVTHAPFLSDSQRSLPARFAVKLYDSFIGPKRLKQFDKVITITKWEKSILKKLGLSDDKIVYIPNGIPKKFFVQKKNPEKNQILFLGRVAPVKNLETLIKAARRVSIKIEIVGPRENAYFKKLISLNPPQSVKFSPPIYNLKDKIKKIDSAKIFVLPSKRESMPQSLIEAMARKKIVIASNNIGAKEIIEDGKNGFLFEVGNEKQLSQKITQALKSNSEEMREKARKSVEQFSWDKIVKKIESIL